MSVDTTEQALTEERRASLPSLSPSRAADFKTCPLLYRFRTIDRSPEPPTPDQARGTLVHAVLERLYDLPAGQRTVEAARDLVAPAWAELREEPGVAELFATAQDDGGESDANAPEAVEAWLASAGGTAGLATQIASLTSISSAMICLNRR